MDNEKELATRPGAEAAEGEETSRQESATASAPEATAAPALAATAELAAAYEELLAEKKDLFDRLLRKQAELENLRKRTQREKEEFRQHAGEDLIRALLPTLDGFERALNHRDPERPGLLLPGAGTDLPRVSGGPGSGWADDD